MYRLEIERGSLMRYYGDIHRERGILVYLSQDEEKETVRFYNIHTRKHGWAYSHEIVREPDLFVLEGNYGGVFGIKKCEEAELKRFYSTPLGLTVLL